MRTNHWSDRYGSIGVLLRSEWLSRTRYESTRSSRPSAFRSSTTRLRTTQPVEAGVLAGVLVVGAVRVEQVDHRQIVAQAGLVIVGVVAGRDLDDAGAEGRVDQQAVGDDRDLPAGQRQVDVLADQVL